MDARDNGDKPASELTKRELLAAMAMQGLLASGEAWFCSDAVRYADEVLAELAKERT